MFQIIVTLSLLGPLHGPGGPMGHPFPHVAGGFPHAVGAMPFNIAANPGLLAANPALRALSGIGNLGGIGMFGMGGMGYGANGGPGTGWGWTGGYAAGSANQAAETPASAFGHAAADIVRSEGEANMRTGAALRDIEEARAKYIQNQKEWTDVYLYKQRTLASAHDTTREANRIRNAQLVQEQASTPSHLPPRLTQTELDPKTGTVAWPAALMRDDFIAARAAMENLLLARIQNGSSSELSAELVNATRDLQDELRLHIRDIVPAEYLTARKFLDRMLLEGLYPVQ